MLTCLIFFLPLRLLSFCISLRPPRPASGIIHLHARSSGKRQVELGKPLNHRDDSWKRIASEDSIRTILFFQDDSFRTILPRQFDRHTKGNPFGFAHCWKNFWDYRWESAVQHVFSLGNRKPSTFYSGYWTESTYARGPVENNTIFSGA